MKMSRLRAATNLRALFSFTLFFLVLPLFSLLVDATPVESRVPLDGMWQFQLDPGDVGREAGWFRKSHNRSEWRMVEVPHTWQVEPGTEEYFGIGWYALELGPLNIEPERDLRIEFDAVYRDATIWLNGSRIGEHHGSGWTPFSFKLNDHWKRGTPNLLVIRVDNRFSKNALPYLNSSDWAADGGIIRPVRLLAYPRPYISQILVDSELSPGFEKAEIRVRLKLEGSLSEEGATEARGFIVRDGGVNRHPLKMRRGDGSVIELRGAVEKPDLWHFDFPNLYKVRVQLYSNGDLTHEKAANFGIRSVEVKNGFFYLNGEPMRLMGVEWMPGSDPRYGMAEPRAIMHRTLTDMKELNAVLTRFHWQQDPFVFEFCDRNGILVQEEVPAWGPRTMKGSLDGVQEAQMKEMISAHYNHPSIYAWGLCNEIGGQSLEAHRFVSRGVEIARSLDPTRLLTWASNSLQTNPQKDASGLVDFIEWNDYWESWYGGSLADLEANLQRIAQAFPEKALVISEYGLCECNPENPVGDARRIEILKTHTDRYRQAKNVAGAIFFDYNDYRTHIGDKGQGSFKQRVHGVVDLLGKRKPSWAALREESSPIRTIILQQPRVEENATRMTVTINTRSLINDLPAYTLRQYLLVWTAYNRLGHPMATGKAVLPDLAPGSVHEETLRWATISELDRVQVEIFRPSGYSVLVAEWNQ